MLQRPQSLFFQMSQAVKEPFWKYGVANILLSGYNNMILTQLWEFASAITNF